MVVIGAGMAPVASAPDNAGPSANGTFQFSVGDGAVRYVSFDARIHNNNTVTGEMTYTDPSALLESDAENPDGSSSVSGLSVKVEFDCLVINGNHAVMSGVVVQSNIGAPRLVARAFPYHLIRLSILSMAMGTFR